jgi:subfamily B ATP-binding cassette protein HlyB/CyaB
VIENSYFKFLSKGSIFSLIPEALDELGPFMEIQLVTPGKIILNDGDILDSLVIPLQEPLSLISNDKVLLLQKGRALSLTSLLRNEPVRYKVVSEEFNKILFLPRSYLMNYFENNKDVLTYLMLMTECESFRRIKHMLTEKGVLQKDIVKFAGIVSSRVPFTEGMLARGILLLEEGAFSIESDEFYADLKGGEFVGGFYAINRPNPGYKIGGSGFVRYIDAEKLRSIGLNKIIQEYLGSEPWIKATNATEHRIKGITEIPKNVLGQWLQSDLGIDPYDIKTCNSDWDSIKETLFMVLKSFDIEINRSIIDNRLLRSPNTICFSVVAELLEHHGLLTKIIRWKEDLVYLKLPLIIPFGNRVVTVINQDEKDFFCFDGILGFYKIKKFYFINNCPDMSITITSLKVPKMEEKEEASKLRMKTFSFIWQIIRTEKKTAMRIGLLTAFTYALGAFSPKLNEVLLDEVLKTEDHQTLWMCLSGLALVGFFSVLFDFMKNKLITQSSMTLDDTLTRFIYAQAMKLTPTSFSKLGTGGILNRLMEMEKIRAFFSTESLHIVFSIGSALIFGSLLASYSSSLVPFIMIYFVVILIIQYFGRKYLYKIKLEEFNLQSKTNSFIGDSVANVLAIKAFSATHSVAKEWEALNTDLAELGKKSAVFQSILDLGVEVLGQITNIGILWYCMSALNTPGKSLSFGEVFAIIQLVKQTIAPMGSLVDFLTNIEDMKLSIDKVNNIIFADNSEDSKAKHSVNITGKIKFDRVSFKYTEDSPLILKDVTLTIYPGQSVAIVGKSGSGKTTIANLIAKENHPTVGRIYFDDVDSTFIDSNEIKSQIGYIQQNNQLFSGSIKSNVAFKDESPDSDRLTYAYAMANCDSFLKNFPQRDDNYLAEGGLGLSGGQKQRLTMARTIYANPKIMILDEATSALDSESENVIINKLLENKGKITSIVIAHRLSTIRSADYVYVVDKGQIVQEGTHNDLILKDGVYKELFQDQAS